MATHNGSHDSAALAGFHGLAQALGLIQQTAVEAADVKLRKLESDPRFVILSHNGELIERPNPPPLRRHTLLNLFDLSYLAVEHCRGTHGQGPRSVSIWHGADLVQAVLNENDRLDTVHFELKKTKVWKRVEELESKLWNQEDLVRLLRVDLAEAAPAEVLAAVRNIRFAKNELETGNIQHAEHSLGRSIDLVCSGAEQLPEGFDVTTPVYSNALEDQPVTVRVLLDVVHSKKAFALSIQGDALVQVMRETQRKLRERLLQHVAVAADEEPEDTGREEETQQPQWFDGRLRIYEGTP